MWLQKFHLLLIYFAFVSVYLVSFCHFILLFIYILTYLLTYSMVHSPS